MGTRRAIRRWQWMTGGRESPIEDDNRRGGGLKRSQGGQREAAEKDQEKDTRKRLTVAQRITPFLSPYERSECSKVRRGVLSF
jgi:hypothetical protein